MDKSPAFHPSTVHPSTVHSPPGHSSITEEGKPSSLTKIVADMLAKSRGPAAEAHKGGQLFKPNFPKKVFLAFERVLKIQLHSVAVEDRQSIRRQWFANLANLDGKKIKMKDFLAFAEVGYSITTYWLTNPTNSEILEKIKILDLSKLGLINIPEEISLLVNLLSLDLHGNKISDLSPLSGLVNLKTLYIYENIDLTDKGKFKELIKNKPIPGYICYHDVEFRYQHLPVPEKYSEEDKQIALIFLKAISSNDSLLSIRSAITHWGCKPSVNGIRKTSRKKIRNILQDLDISFTKFETLRELLNLYGDLSRFKPDFTKKKEKKPKFEFKYSRNTP
jgi:hypothetical protein